MTIERPSGSISALRLTTLGAATVRPEREFILYWMTSARRVAWNHALDRALDWGEQLGKPVVILEALRSDYPWASDRLHAFVLRGMADNSRSLTDRPLHYYPYVEQKQGAGKGLVEALAGRAAVVVTDEFPCFFLPRMLAAVAPRLDVPLEVVDSNGLLPLRATEQPFPTAYAFRRFLQKTLPGHLEGGPRPHPFRRRELPTLAPDALRSIEERWAPADAALLEAQPAALGALPIDHGVTVVAGRGGRSAGRRELKRFLDERFERYNEDRNDPVDDVSSGLSPYLHFGQVSAYECFAEIAAREEGWSRDLLDPRGNGGKRAGWWHMSAPAEALLDQLVTWRELGYVFCHHRPRDYDSLDALPDFARKTLYEHARDERPHLYDLDTFERAETHDELWNATQRQLRREGRIHNYLRMLWGKKILHWTAGPEQALEVMIELNNRFALDGRNPNSYAGIFWVLGRFDRAWGPERPIFGKVRYMTSENTARKMNVRPFLSRYSAQGALF